MSDPHRGPVTVAAVDLGAASGRVIAATVGADRLDLVEACRFDNTPVRVGGTLHWDALALHRGILDGLRAAGRHAGGVDSVGIDGWAVDYGLLDADGALLGNPVHYRDGRTDGVPDRVATTLPRERMYQLTGIQFLQFNTVYQLVAATGSAQLAAARTVLLLPDLFSYWLTGVAGTEVTNASTTALLDAGTRQWAGAMFDRLGLRRDLFAPLRQPGEPAGGLLPDVAAATGLPAGLPVTAVGSHDTASAVVAVPMDGAHAGYISCGTWSLVGVELDTPVLTAAGLAAGFTNETGVDGTVRYLRNVMGLWLLQESVRTWQQSGQPHRLDELLAAAGRLPALVRVVDPDDPVFLPPGDMPARIAAACRRTGQPEPDSPAATVRCILDSLALAHRAAVHDAQRLTGREIRVVHLVGGGCRNELLCQLTADACGLPVHAGPVEATAIGNALVQARALGAVHGGLAELRALVGRAVPPRSYLPRAGAGRWELAAARLAGD